jgi:hypothetical protein
MRNPKLHRPSPALVVSVIALSVALGGTSYAAIVLPANSVGTRQIKKNAVTTAKVKNGSLRLADFGAGQIPAGAAGPPGAAGATGATGAIGARGATGATGATGPKGDKGEKGDPGTNGSNGADGTANVVVRESASTPVAASAIVSVTVPCLAGERATGGGYDASGNGEFGTIALDSQPTASAAVPNGWTVKVNNVTTLAGNPQPSAVVAKVICVAP